MVSTFAFISLSSGSYSSLFDKEIADVDQKPEDKISSVKRVALMPMSTEEAVLQMDTMGHLFLVFRNTETGEINVIYKKKEGEYGLLELYE